MNDRVDGRGVMIMIVSVVFDQGHWVLLFWAFCIVVVIGNICVRAFWLGIGTPRYGIGVLDRQKCGNCTNLGIIL